MYRNLLNIFDLLVFIYIIALFYNLFNVNYLINLIKDNNIIKLSILILIILIGYGFGDVKKKCFVSALLLSIAFLLTINSNIIDSEFFDNSSEDNQDKKDHDSKNLENSENTNEVNRENVFNEEEDHTNNEIESFDNFNQNNLPEPYRPNSSVLGSGEPDPLSQCGQDFLSCPPGPFSQNGLSYNFNMA